MESVPTRSTLEALLRRARGGEARPRDEIFAFLGARFLRLAKLRIGEEDAHDVLQEALMVIDAHLGELESVEGLLAYGHQVLRNKIGNYYRKRDRRKPHHGELDAAPEPSVTIDEELETADLKRLLARAIERLGETRPLCRTLLDGLCKGRSIRDLSEQVRLRRSQVDDRLFRCRRMLRRVLVDDFRVRL